MSLMLERGARWLLLLTVLTALVSGARSWQQFRIDTDLSALAPGIALPTSHQQAINGVAADLQKRLVFLLDSPSADMTEDAAIALQEALENLPTLALVDTDQTLQSLQSLMSDHRFQLLTAEQRQMLQLAEVDQLANAAVASRYSLSGTPQLLPFNQDPLAWHSRYLLEALSAMGADESLPDTQWLISAVVLGDGAAVDGGSELVAELAALREALQRDYPQVAWYQSGMLFHATAAARDSRDDITRITTVSGMAIIVLLLWLFRSLWALLVPVASVVIGIAFAFLVTQWWFGSVHVIAIVFGASLVGVVIDYSLHFFFHGQSGGDGDRSRSSLHRALLLSLLTSLVGYSALMWSSLAVLSQVAVFSCSGMAMAMLVVLALCPLVAERLVVKSTAVAASVRLMLAPWKRLTARTMAGVAGLLILAALLAWWSGLRQQDNPASFVASDPQLMAMEVFIANHTEQYEPGSFVVASADSEDQLHRHMARLQSLLDSSDDLSRSDVVSLTQWVPSASQQQDNYHLQQVLYDRDGVLERYLRQLHLPLSLAREAEEEYRRAQGRQLTMAEFQQVVGSSLPPLWYRDGSHIINLVLLKKGVDLVALDALLQQDPHLYLHRSLAAAEQALATQKRRALTMLVCAYGLVALFLLWFYRRWSALGIIALPVCGAALVIIAFWVSGVALNLFHVMGLFLALGLGLDYGIFVREMRAVSQIALQAVAVSAVTSLLSFGLLAVSAVPVAHSFGLTLLIANGVNFVGSLAYAAALERRAG